MLAECTQSITYFHNPCFTHILRICKLLQYCGIHCISSIYCQYTVLAITVNPRFPFFLALTCNAESLLFQGSLFFTLSDSCSLSSLAWFCTLWVWNIFLPIVSFFLIIFSWPLPPAPSATWYLSESVLKISVVRHTCI